MKDRLGWNALVALVSSAFSLTLVAWTLGTGCTWPDYTIDTTDLDANAFDSAPFDSTSFDAEAAVDTAPFVLPDGRTCTGHDEDGDGVPDECDNCPNVANTTQGLGNVGDACKPSAAFIPTPTRLYFDPFKKLSSDYKQFTDSDAGPAPFTLGSDGDSIVGGLATDPDVPPPPFRFITGATGADVSAITVTTVMTMQASNRGNAGIILRVNGAPAKFLICALSVDDGFAAAHAPDSGCSGGPCGAVAFPLPTADGGAIAAQVPIPADVPHAIGDAIGFRASITKSDTAGDFECRVFNPKVPSTLTSSDAKYAVKVSVPSSRWLAAGEIGLYSQKAKTQFNSVDVLRGP